MQFGFFFIFFGERWGAGKLKTLRMMLTFSALRAGSVAEGVAVCPDPAHQQHWIRPPGDER
jgi:ABC-type uncharacterized transport system ATPase subunit